MLPPDLAIRGSEIVLREIATGSPSALPSESQNYSTSGPEKIGAVNQDIPPRRVERRTHPSILPVRKDLEFSYFLRHQRGTARHHH
jgi:hypothetical protein